MVIYLKSFYSALKTEAIQKEIYRIKGNLDKDIKIISIFFFEIYYLRLFYGVPHRNMKICRILCRYLFLFIISNFIYLLIRSRVINHAAKIEQIQRLMHAESIKIFFWMFKGH